MNINYLLSALKLPDLQSLQTLLHVTNVDQLLGLNLNNLLNASGLDLNSIGNLLGIPGLGGLLQGLPGSPCGGYGIPVIVTNVPLPVWVVKFNACTSYEISLTQSLTNLFAQKQKAERKTQVQDIQKAREDVNKLVATVYNELRTQQVALNYGELRDILPSLGIAVTDDDTDEICKAAYQVKASVGGQQQCVAVVQEARIITNKDDYIYEESRRRATDMLFCYLGDWRHFPIAKINDPSNCEQLGLPLVATDEGCSEQRVWQKLGELVYADANHFSDVDGTKTPLTLSDDQHVHNLCEGMRKVGKKCAQDMLRDYIKYSTIDKITRKDRTIILAPPQTWYTPERCDILGSFLPQQDSQLSPPGHETPYTKNIKSLDIVNPDKFTSSFQYINYWYGSKFGNISISKPPANMTAAEYSIEKELQAINVPENNFSGLASKTEQLANQIITEVTDLRKLQYTSGEGLRDATLRIGWQDYEWQGSGNFLGKYPALDLPLQDAKKPNKIFKPLPCYWQSQGGGAKGCFDTFAGASPSGKYFYFDTGLVIAPISITKDKLQSAIQAQFDLAAKAFDDRQAQGFKASCGAFANGSTGNFLPAPWEDTKVNLSTAINPLTGQPYTTGTPGPNNPPFRIPDLPNNYFNVIYNDVFQLYHTPFPDVLAKWFRIGDTPGYDSIYGLGDPLVNNTLANAGPGGQGPHFPHEPPPTDKTGPLPIGCAAYHKDFQTIGTEQGVDGCLLEAIGAAESSCNPNAVSSHGACGLMQILPSTAGVSCDTLRSNPQLSIQLAAQYLKTSAGIIGGYQSMYGYNIGNQFTLSGKQVVYASNTYDTGNDDLVASYNAGYGDHCGSPKQTFCPSSDCPSPKTPSWQCHINPGGFSQTQVYVQRVQNYQAQCNAGLSHT